MTQLTKVEPKRVGYTITEVAAMTGRHRTTIHRWLEQGVLRAIPVRRGRRLVQAASLERLINGTVAHDRH
jgi:excisionase family DNA binding protein